ncbi:MAG: hypothetical protein ABFD97_08210 [Syntrophobacter sp.]
MTEAEIKAYTAGYNTAMRHMRDIIQNWTEAREGHQDCECAYCKILRELAKGCFGGVAP